ncbi:MAG: hypothetical protein KDJ65_21980, partial [Anaerolineae bacterium]|nr:hypothetical protein [Anaerolineae bacterium]
IFLSLSLCLSLVCLAPERIDLMFLPNHAKNTAAQSKPGVVLPLLPTPYSLLPGFTHSGGRVS